MGKFWNNATVGTAAGTVIAGVVGAIGLYLIPSVATALAWLREAWRFFVADVTLPRSIFWLWLLLTVAICLVFAARAWAAFTDSPAWLSEFQAYRTDQFFGFRWRWDTTASGEVHTITMFCPECDYQLRSNDFDLHFDGTYFCKCQHCGYVHDVDGLTTDDLTSRVAKEAEGKIRTGEWTGAAQ
jgi:hypothetical protein